jgi:hypothetical protein
MAEPPHPLVFVVVNRGCRTAMTPSHHTLSTLDFQSWLPGKQAPATTPSRLLSLCSCQLWLPHQKDINHGFSIPRQEPRTSSCWHLSLLLSTCSRHVSGPAVSITEPPGIGWARIPYCTSNILEISSPVSLEHCNITLRRCTAS